MRDEIVGVILAGGKSSRMGKDKALLDIRGTPLIKLVTETIKQVFGRVIVVANDAQAYQFLGLEVVPDVFKECGPLGGIHAAFVHSDSSSVFITACDTPCISPDLIRYILSFPSQKSVKIPVAAECEHPLCGVYHRDIFPALVHRLEQKKLKVLDFLEEISYERIPITSSLSFYKSDFFININTESDRSECTSKLIQ
jgi:molybdopterin-guanine dinucleotide biosynthesis protein A